MIIYDNIVGVFMLCILGISLYPNVNNDINIISNEFIVIIECKE